MCCTLTVPLPRITPMTSNRNVSPGFSKREIQTLADRLSSRCLRQLTALTGPPKSSDARVFTSTKATARPAPSRRVATRSMSRRPFRKRRSAISQPCTMSQRAATCSPLRPIACRASDIRGNVGQVRMVGASSRVVCKRSRSLEHLQVDGHGVPPVWRRSNDKMRRI